MDMINIYSFNLSFLKLTLYVFRVQCCQLVYLTYQSGYT